MKTSQFGGDLLKIITKSVENKIYGSVEIYFEEGKITQVTQRIINKMPRRSDHPKRVETDNLSHRLPT